jgi:basic membrane lipoprotein Med (substrate-binding protein (PBP1-ABC) superfamily)
MKAAAERGAWAIGYVADQNHVAPQKVLTSIVLDKKSAYVRMIRDVHAGAFEGKGYLFDMLADGVRMAPYRNVSPDVVNRLKQAEQDMRDGKLKVPDITQSTK